MKIINDIKKLRSSKKVPKLEFRYKRSNLSKIPLRDTEEQVHFLRKIFDKATFQLQEEMILLILDDEELPVCYYSLAKGTKESVETDMRILFQILLASGAERFILSHNHPSGPALASWADIDLTHATLLRAKMFGLEFIDHIIISSLKGKKKSPGYFSLVDNGLLLNFN